MRRSLAIRALTAVASVALLSCGENPVTPLSQLPNASLLVSVPPLVISQIYGGGGNSGATYTHDFVELFNPGAVPVAVDGWSVQYASASGTTWSVTALSGTVQPGHYYLIRMAQGSGGTTPLPTPDATGSTAMSATAGKVVLATSTTAFAGIACPADGNVMDLVPYGSTANCANPTATLSNTTAALRGGDGCTYTGNASVDFSVAAPNPRNSGSAARNCPAAGPPALVSVTPSTDTVDVGAMQAFTATAYDANGQVTSTTFTWSSSNDAIATIDPASGIATGVAAGSVTLTATAANNVSGSATLVVEAAAPPVPMPDPRFSEIHYDNFGTDTNEAIEVEGPAGTNLTGWRIILYNGNGGAAYSTTVLNATITNTCDGRGVVYVSYPSNGIQNGSPDGFALVDAADQVVEFLSYEGVFTAADGPAAGMQSIDIGNSEESAPVGQSLRRTASNTWVLHTANFGACADDPAPAPPNSITFSGRTASDAALPVGFEDQLFATEVDGATGVSIVTTFTWLSDTPGIASIDARGVFRALSAGTAVLRATAADGTTGTISLPTIVALANPAASYVGNTEFGDPTDGDPSDDFIIRRAQYTTSFNNLRGIPNWVSYDLEAPHMVAGQDRCDCFTFDPELQSAGFAPYNTADYTGAGTAAGYAIDRGHLVRSFDRTIGTLDNATTFYFSNIVPQAADNNQGPWAAAESYLGNLAATQNKELYIIAGASGNKGTVKNEGRITIPTHVWKVAVIMPRDQGLADIDDEQDLEVIALIMPNDAGIRNVDWQTYKTTVDAVEALSGYDLLKLLPDKIEIAVESGTHAPVAATDGPYTALAGETISMSAAGSSDADGDALTYAWSFGDGGSGAGVTTTHAYSSADTYTVQVIVTDIRGIADTATTSAVVLSAQQAVQGAYVMIDDLSGVGGLNGGIITSLKAKLDAAAKAVQADNSPAAIGTLQSLLNDLDALTRSGRLNDSDAQTLRDWIERIIAIIE